MKTGPRKQSGGSDIKLRHVATLALVAWYMLTPPLVSAPYKINTEAPLATWNKYRTFDSKEACDKYLSSEQARYKKTADAPSGTIKRGSRAFALQMVFARCVPSDDPNLKPGAHQPVL